METSTSSSRGRGSTLRLVTGDMEVGFMSSVGMGEGAASVEEVRNEERRKGNKSLNFMLRVLR